MKYFAYDYEERLRPEDSSYHVYSVVSPMFDVMEISMEFELPYTEANTQAVCLMMILLEDLCQRVIDAKQRPFSE